MAPISTHAGQSLFKSRLVIQSPTIGRGDLKGGFGPMDNYTAKSFLGGHGRTEGTEREKGNNTHFCFHFPRLLEQTITR